MSPSPLSITLTKEGLKALLEARDKTIRQQTAVEREKLRVGKERFFAQLIKASREANGPKD